MNITKRLNRSGDKIVFYYDFGRTEGHRHSTGIFIYQNPKDQIQKNHDDHFLKALNIPAGERIKQMMVNLERMKWMPKRPENFIFINIPEYRFRLIEDSKVLLTMDIVVGKAANRTVIFSDELKYIVFSPYWNVPRSIVRNEILPAMKRNPSYLRRNNMEITGYSAGLPIVRQKPGRSNALGQVKFLFPNSYNIYFHDTPAKSLFSRERRAFSHGCIRLEQPFALAQYLLKGDSLRTDVKIKQAMSRKTEKWVTLKKTWPVYITYFTSWADGEGMVHFLEDIYRHDYRLMQRLFE
ncbi:MAG TPA: L,D-transpeptidase family protein [Chitinophagaceae bacterium]|jgi:murein L,D-transpeptidase YcbB/YkuD|nr:L,D-transpeptidase family protein [Chitinophagaceae bacterium]